MAKTRLLLVDDQLLFIRSLKMVLESVSGEIEVVGLAYNGEEAVKLAEKLSPDVILMDVRMPKMDGVEATRLIHERFPQIRILMLTTFENDEFIQRALGYGASGYLLKDIAPRVLITSIHAVEQGILQISPAIAHKLVGKVKGTRLGAAANEEKKAELRKLFATLSAREKEILNFIEQGCDNKEIAAHSFLAVQTVKNHISSIYEKLDVKNRLQLLKVLEILREDRTASPGREES